MFPKADRQLNADNVVCAITIHHRDSYRMCSKNQMSYNVLAKLSHRKAAYVLRILLGVTHLLLVRLRLYILGLFHSGKTRIKSKAAYVIIMLNFL